METHNPTTKTCVTILAATIFFSILATIASSNQITIAQGQPSTQPNPNAPLSFFLKLGNNQSTSAASSQAASNGTGTKNIVVTVNVQKGPSGSPIKLPISAVVPKNVNQQDLQLCASLQNGKQKCQPLTQNAPNIDLSASSAAATTTPQAYHGGSSVSNILKTLSSQIIQYADAQLLSLNNTNLNIPITVIVPITLEIQNAQICASVASSGGTTCQQLVLNPTQTAFTPVNVDMSKPTTPTLTLSASVPTTQLLTGGATGTNNTGTASTGTNNTAGTTSGGGGGTNSTSTQGTSPSSTTTSNQPSSTSQQPTSTQPSQDNTNNNKNNDNKNNGNSDKKNQ
jgi:hypothetical protein